MESLVTFQRQITIASMDISIYICFEAFGNKHSCRMANLEVFLFVPDLLLSRRFAPGQIRKSGTKTKTSKFAMQQIYLPLLIRLFYPCFAGLEKRMFYSLRY